MSVFQKIRDGLAATRNTLMSGVEKIFRSFVSIDENLFDELEELLISSDMGVETSMSVTETLRERVKTERVTDAEQIKKMLAEEISARLVSNGTEFCLPVPSVLLVVGVNGVGKTTTIGKLAKLYKDEGKSVLIAAADTFRAAAVDQLAIWCNRAGVGMIKHAENSDPAAVVFDAVQAAKARKTDILICDTAGRLHNKKNLMDELKKIFKIINTQYADAHKEVFLVLDATTGQNALQQAKIFKETAEITGIVLTKLDGTAKGGIIVSIHNELNVPVRYVTLGEGIEDIEPFDAVLFAKALSGN
ncbi:MAG: signal recognition particle-docking protein FtsY [Defluviitaleaceae bacterium]|nr:signal recognition particle-docking protein FtsY [Defluviitaleaceae bacterium]